MKRYKFKNYYDLQLSNIYRNVSLSKGKISATLHQRSTKQLEVLVLSKKRCTTKFPKNLRKFKAILLIRTMNIKWRKV